MDFKAFKDGELLRIPLTAVKNELYDNGNLYTLRSATIDAVSHECNNTIFTVAVKNEIFVKAKSCSRNYGEVNPDFEYTVEGGTFEGTPEIMCDASVTSPVGEYPIVLKNGSVLNHFVTYVNGTLIIEKAPLTVMAGEYTMKQGAAMPDFIASYEGFKNNETEAVLTKHPTLPTTATPESELGTYEVVVSDAEAQNYDISYTKGTLTVTEADPVAITANSYTREYGDTNPVFEFTSEGAALDGEPEIVCEATETSPVGIYDIVVKQGTVKNYNVSYVDGTLTVTKAPLTIKAGEYTMKQGDVLPEFIASYEGWKNNETEAVLTKLPTLTTTVTSESEPGEYPIFVSDAEAENYNISYLSGKLIVTENELNSVLTPSIIEDALSNQLIVYTITGVKLYIKPLKELKKGLYIVNGKIVNIH